MMDKRPAADPKNIKNMTEPMGPVYTGNIEEFVATEGGRSYRVHYLPDKSNYQLQQEEKPAHFYWMPAEVRLAQDPVSGAYKFHLTRFAGTMSEETHVGVEGDRDVAGGILSFTTTAKPPENVLKQAHEQLIERFRGDSDRYWGIRHPATPQFGPMPIAAAETSMSNLSPNSDGSVPAFTEPTVEADGGATMAATPERTREAPTRELVDTVQPISSRDATSARSMLDAWFVQMHGQGPSSIDPGGENAFSGLVGALPAQLLWAGFHGEYSPVSVTQAMKLKLWTETIRLRITGSWKRIHQHFSAHATGGVAWFSGDIKAELNKMIQSGDLKVELNIDGTMPSADEHRKAVEKRMDLILTKFMEQAQKTIFDPEPPKVEPAEAKRRGFFSPGLSVAFKLRRDVTELDLNYEEVINERYLQDHVISSTLRGFYDEIKADPDAEKKYFTTLTLDDWPRKVTRIFKPVVNWPDPAKKWIGEPVAFLSAQVGYPNADGAIMWSGTVFDKGNDTEWKPAFTMKRKEDVENSPADWEPDKTYIDRRVHLMEPPSAAEYPYSRVEIEKNVIHLDPGENGRLTSDIPIEVRADSMGTLEVDEIFLDTILMADNEMVIVSLRPLGTTENGRERNWTRFLFRNADQFESRFWKVFTGDPEFELAYEYQVTCIVGGTGGLGSRSQRWTGPVQTVYGDGPVVVQIPSPDEAVDVRDLGSREIIDIGRAVTDGRELAGDTRLARALAEDDTEALESLLGAGSLEGDEVDPGDSSTTEEPDAPILGMPGRETTGGGAGTGSEEGAGRDAGEYGEEEAEDELTLVDGWYVE